MDPNNSNPNNSPPGASFVPTLPPVPPTSSAPSANPVPIPQAVPPPPPSQPKVIVSSGSHRRAFLLGILAVFLLVGLGAGVYLVRQQQDIRSKATGTCDMRWPADPGTTCGQTTQSPAQGAQNVSLTPSFHWDYGGYRTGETSCVQPSGCGTYGATLYLAEGGYSDNSIIASCSLPAGASPIKDAPFSCLRVWRDGPALSPLKPSTAYSWRITPYFDGVVHAEQTWNYTFTTGAGTPPPTLTVDCVSLTTNADLNNLQIGTLYNFTLTTGGNAPISSVSMPVYMGSCSNQVSGDAPLRGISGRNTYTIGWRPMQPGPFVAYGKVASGTTTCQADCGGTLCSGAASCKLTGTVKAASTPTAACQMVSADKDLTKIKIGDTVKFTGYGAVDSASERIDKINFILIKDNAAIAGGDTTVDAVRAQDKDSGGNQFYVATQSAQINAAGSYSMRIRVHWQSADRWLE